jgi:N utilization substance protein B
MGSGETTSRRENRIFAVQFMYAWSINKNERFFETAAVVDDFVKLCFPEDGCRHKFGRELAIGTVENIDVIDELIGETVAHWSFDRITVMDLAILRVAAYEMLFREDVPPIVAMNEAIDIGKTMSTDKSGRFLNGVLDGIKKKLTRPWRGIAIHSVDEIT